VYKRQKRRYFHEERNMSGLRGIKWERAAIEYELFLLMLKIRNPKYMSCELIL
jgi:hypothetical protein